MKRGKLRKSFQKAKASSADLFSVVTRSTWTTLAGWRRDDRGLPVPSNDCAAARSRCVRMTA